MKTPILRFLIVMLSLFGCTNHHDHSVNAGDALKLSAAPTPKSAFALTGAEANLESKNAAIGAAKNESEPVIDEKIAPLGTDRSLDLLDGNQYRHCDDLDLKKIWNLKDGSHTQIIAQGDQLLSLDTTSDLKTYSDLQWNADDCMITKTISQKNRLSGNAVEKEASEAGPQYLKVIGYSETRDANPHHTLKLAPCLDTFCTQILKNEAWDLDENTQ